MKNDLQTDADSVSQDQLAHPADNEALRSAYMGVPADLELHCPHLSERHFLRGVSHILLIILYKDPLFMVQPDLLIYCYSGARWRQ